MGKETDVLKPLEESSVSRRSFLKGTAALGAMAALKMAAQILYTGGADSSTNVEIPETGEVKYFYGSSGHNCGGRCVSRAEVINGKIKRILTDESLYTSDGTYIDPESRNFPQTRSCSRCRSYKYRLYHPGRLLYPLKQTKTRGDLSGFKRITL